MTSPEKADTTDLLPCPFCGGPAELDNAAEPQFARRPTVTCANESCFGYMPSAYFARDAEAIAAWNRRTPAPSPDTTELVERLTRALSMVYWPGRDEPYDTVLAARDTLQALSSQITQLTEERDRLRAALTVLLASVDGVLCELKPGQSLSPSGAGRTNALEADRNSARRALQSRATP